MKTVAYLRVSTRSQDLDNQKLAILDYAQKQQIAVDRFDELQVSSRQVRHRESIERLLLDLAEGDRLLVSELSRLGRSLGQVIQIVDTLVHRKIRFTAIKEIIVFTALCPTQTLLPNQWRGALCSPPDGVQVGRCRTFPCLQNPGCKDGHIRQDGQATRQEP